MVTFAEIQNAAQRIRSYIHRTPVMTCASVNQRAGMEVYAKCENFQRGGSFKLRGAANFVLSIPDADIGRGVVAFSSGNHAQAVAIAAAIRGVQATLVMPSDAPQSKREATEARGGQIVLYDRLREDREAIGKRIAQQTGATLIPPFDHPWIIAGQGTAALELLEEVPDLDALAVCLGGGGLLSGCAIAAKALQPSIRIFGVEPAVANDWALSLAAGSIVEIPPPPTIADGLRATKPGQLTFPIVRQFVEEVLLVSEAEILAAMKFLLLRAKILVEPSGAVAAAAVLHRKLPPGVRKVGVILSGGNVDWELLQAA
ncbi:MAG: pyridoxal-phosphate dependent enzyme [Bryobacteraceae bacterium]|nr:pyridoxal-phosphate dependent enzyme [Bryobacteraceae bacterium]MDW8379861.1 pyridoxal-phosphate dependent enzyme [Bryobacterales bacterium]